MTNLEQNNIEYIECDETTASNYLAMADMEETEEDNQVGSDVEAEWEEPLNVTHFANYNISNNHCQGFYNNSFSIDDIESYSGNYSEKQMSNGEIQNVAKDIFDAVQSDNPQHNENW